MNIIAYQDNYKTGVVKLMQQLQDTERKLSRDRPPGADMASDHTDYLLALCREKQGTLLVALEDTVVAGFIVVITEQEDEGDQHLYSDYRSYGLVTDLVVDEEYRGHGIARMLMKAAEQYCLTRGLKQLHVTALYGNAPARGFYDSYGFSEYEITYRKSL
ncbi:hypothetical protein GCM10023116_27300 [Kistimonas scapharcae]|uniref:N-acetyltransferase domain-containing protein n=1 Tax=Kistimonas scapharcae TaxID=1036133 RepID=A0ABP8V685_9GAMM